MPSNTTPFQPPSKNSSDEADGNHAATSVTPTPPTLDITTRRSFHLTLGRRKRSAEVVEFPDTEVAASVTIRGQAPSDLYATNLTLTGYAVWFGADNLARCLAFDTALGMGLGFDSLTLEESVMGFEAYEDEGDGDGGDPAPDWMGCGEWSESRGTASLDSSDCLSADKIPQELETRKETADMPNYLRPDGWKCTDDDDQDLPNPWHGGCEMNVLELGSGLGLAGISAIKIMSEIMAVASRMEGNMHAEKKNTPPLSLGSFVLTDGEAELLPVLRENCELNGLSVVTPMPKDLPVATMEEKQLSLVECRKLCWGDGPDLTAVQLDHPHGFNLIIGSDLLYTNGGTMKALFRTVQTLLSAVVGSRFLLAQTRRNLDIDSVLECAREHGFIWKLHPQGTYDIFGNHVDEQTMFWRDAVFVFQRRLEGKTECQ